MDVRWTDKWYIPLLIVYHRKEPDPIESPFNINQIETLMLSREPSISQCIVASPPTKKKSTNFRWNYCKRSFEFARQKYNSGEAGDPKHVQRRNREHLPKKSVRSGHGSRGRRRGGGKAAGPRKIWPRRRRGGACRGGRRRRGSRGGTGCGAGGAEAERLRGGGVCADGLNAATRGEKIFGPGFRYGARHSAP